MKKFLIYGILQCGIYIIKEGVLIMKSFLLHIRTYIIISLFLFLSEITATSIILLFPGLLIDSFINNKLSLINMIILYIVTFSIYLFITYISNRVADYRRIKFEKKIKQDFFESIMRKSFLKFYEYDLGEYISMQSNDITQMCQNYLSPLLAIFRSIIMIIIFGISLIIFTDTIIAMVIIAFSFFVVFVPKITEHSLSRKNEVYTRALGKYTSSVQKYFISHDILDKKGIEKINIVHREKLDNLMDKNMDFRKVNSLALVINGGVVEFISIVTFIVVGYLLYNSNITIGMATIAFTYSTKFMEPIFELNLNIGRVKSVKKIKEKLISILKTENKSYKTIKKLEKIYFNNLKITLNDNMLVYDELKLDFPKKYLITGENGSGKSVLAKLIMGFLVANEGKILYNDLNSINISEHISYVPQVPVIFEGSYIDNITIYGTYSYKNLELYESCFPSRVIKNIKSNENLENLSSGEKQIIAIIRAFCSEKEFIILDEALSVMNQITIEKFMETIFNLNKSIVIIAHNVDEYKDRFYKTYKVIRKEI